MSKRSSNRSNSPPVARVGVMLKKTKARANSCEKRGKVMDPARIVVGVCRSERNGVKVERVMKKG